MDWRKTFQRFSAERLIVAGLVLLGLALRLRQYLTWRSLWLDEAMLALNLIGRSFGRLTQPLDYEQGGPLGFLLAEKLVISLLNNHNELVLRLLPLLAGCAALLIFALLLPRVNGKAGTYTALALFALSGSLVYYSSEVKQYASDVFVSVLLLWLALRVLDSAEAGRALVWLGVAGALAVWCSHPAIFVLAAIAATLLLHYALQKDGRGLKQTGILLAAWAASFGVLYFVSLRALAADPFLLNYWGDAFMPLPPWAEWNWFPQTLLSVLDNPLGLASVWGLAVVLMLLGLAGLLRRRWQAGALLVLTLAAALAASALGKYPFTGRMVLFAVPVFLTLIGAGLELAAGWVRHPRWMVALTGLGLAFLLLYQPAVGAAQNFAQPRYYEHIRPTMAYLQANRRPGDVLYIDYWAVPAFRYYAPFYHFGEADFMAGNDHTNDPQGLRAEIDALRGNKRVWVLFSHVYQNEGFNAKEVILAHLDEIGKRVREFREPGTSVDLLLYDLGAP